MRGVPGTSIPLRTVAVLSNPLRYAFDEAAKQATQFAGRATTRSRRWRSGDAPGLEHVDYYSPIRSTFASGAHAAIVEIDPATWEIDVVKYAVVHDCGNVVNPMIVEGQVHGGVAQGVGGALYERMAYDSDGQLQNASFMDFLMPYASEVPDVVIDHQETPSPLNPLGIKGAGEAGVIPGTAAIASAIEDAVGRRISSMPISPTELYDLMRNPDSELTARPLGAGREQERWREPRRLCGAARRPRAGVVGDHRPGGAGADDPGLRVAGAGRGRRVQDERRRSASARSAGRTRARCGCRTSSGRRRT